MYWLSNLLKLYITKPPPEIYNTKFIFNQNPKILRDKIFFSYHDLTMKNKFVRSGVSAFVLKMPERRLLLIGRENPPGKGLLCFPGGTQEYGETMMHAMIREVREETGHIIQPPKADHRPPVVVEVMNKDYDCHWIIHCGIFEAIDKVPALEQNIEWEWFATDKNDKECRHVSEFQDSEVIKSFWDVYRYFIPSVDHNNYPFIGKSVRADTVSRLAVPLNS